MKRVKIDLLQPGDIVLTARRSPVGKGIRLSTWGLVSHAMICVQHGSVIDSTSDGVQARNIQRELFDAGEEVFAFRLREPLDETRMARVIDFARSEIGARYSNMEAARSVIPGSKPRTRRQFCSRLVARSYAHVGIKLVGDQDYCTPEDLRVSPLLRELSDIAETVSEDELAAWREHPNPLDLMRSSQNAVLAAARELDPSVEHLGDLDQLVQNHPEWDALIAQSYRDSGYLDVWKDDCEINPWRYDIAAMEAFSDKASAADLRAYCVSTIREFYSGGVRFAVNLRHYRAVHQASRRETRALLIALYEQLVRNDQLRRDTALAWLKRHYPEDAEHHLQRIIPHSELWFSIVDRVEPNLGAIARISIAQVGSSEVCSSCGDPARDYRLVNGAEAMPGVPSLRLCDDCIGIRRDMGEVLEPFT